MDFTLAGIILILIGGYGAVVVAALPLAGTVWLAIGQLLFAAKGIIWLGILIQIRQARVARLMAPDSTVPSQYPRDSRSWLIWGVVATVPLVAAVYVLMAKPL